MAKSSSALGARDVAEIAIGSALLAFPVATTEEVWNLSTTLSPLRIVAIGLTSVLVVAAFVVVVYHKAEGSPNRRDFWHRVIAVYGVTLVVCAGILWMLDRLPLAELSVAIKRTMLVAFPASFSATVVDSLG